MMICLSVAFDLFCLGIDIRNVLVSLMVCNIHCFRAVIGFRQSEMSACWLRFSAMLMPGSLKQAQGNLPHHITILEGCDPLLH